jgi:hypothetical protein
MPLNEEDLKFRMTIDPDTAKAQAAFKDLGKDIDDQARRIKSEFSLLPQEKILTSIDGALKENNLKWAIQSRIVSELEADLRKISNESLAPQESLLTGIGSALEANNSRWEQQAKLINTVQDDLSKLASDGLLPTENMLKGIGDVLESNNARWREQNKLAGDQAKIQANLVAMVHEDIGKYQTGNLLPPEHMLKSIDEALSKKPEAVRNPVFGLGPSGGQSNGITGEGAADGLLKFGLVVGGLTGGALLASAAISKLKNSIIGLVEAAAPASVYKWEYTVRDFQGVLGQRLAPILDKGTDLLRSFADAMADCLPSTDQMKQALRDLDPLLKLVTISLKGLAEAATLNFGRGHETDFYRDKDGVLHRGKEASSFGAAARPAHYSGIEEYAKRFQESALSAASLQSIPEKQLGEAEKQTGLLSKIAEILGVAGLSDQTRAAADRALGKAN